MEPIVEADMPDQGPLPVQLVIPGAIVIRGGHQTNDAINSPHGVFPFGQRRLNHHGGSNDVDRDVQRRAPAPRLLFPVEVIESEVAEDAEG